MAKTTENTYMTLYFGLEFDDLVFHQQDQTQGGIQYFGPQKLLFMLEAHLGLIGHPANNEHLRIEQYRQALQWYFQQDSEVFYQRSFQADQLATATALLQMRDTLHLANWQFSPKGTNIPERLVVLAKVESFFKASTSLQLSPGYADRFLLVLAALERKTLPINQLFVNEPFSLLPKHFKRLFDLLTQKGVQVQQMPDPTLHADSDLGVFQQCLQGTKASQGKQTLKKDGSLLILKTKRETDAANFLARFFRKNPDFRPLCLIPEKNRALDNALIQEGLPSLGILSASLARPSLQILKLVSTFLWKPIDPYKILEFVSLSIKPLEEELGRRIAMQIASTPGLKGEGWSRMIAIYFEELQARAANDSNIDVALIRDQYQFWFERKKLYSLQERVPNTEVIDIFHRLKKWASKAFEDSGSKNTSFLVLSEQAKRIIDLVEALPEKENDLSHLELERIVRTIYEPSPVLFKAREVGHLPHIHHNSAILGKTRELLWWNFTRNEPNYFFSRWYQAEINYLAQTGIALWGPKEDNALLLWQRPRPVFYSQEKLLLVLPGQVDGSEVYPHPLHDELEACFGDLSGISLDLDHPNDQTTFAHFFILPETVPLPPKQLGVPQPFLQIGKADKMDQNESETFTSLDTLFYYPYQWVFRHKTKLRKSSILSIVSDVTLKGNLAHRFFELLLKKEDVENWDRPQTEAWINSVAPGLLAREGAVLLMYGREPERVAFINRIKKSAWALLSMIQNNDWKVVDTEKSLQGAFQGTEVRAKADVVLSRGEEFAILDLKWRGARRRENLVRNEADLQLVMYSRLLEPIDQWAHTAFFIIQDSLMIARNQMAFKEARAVSADANHIEINERIWSKMETTFRWRIQQLKQGKIEVRTSSTLPDIEESYAQEDWLELLELPAEEAYFDDYRTLINLVD